MNPRTTPSHQDYLDGFAEGVLRGADLARREGCQPPGSCPSPPATPPHLGDSPAPDEHHPLPAPDFDDFEDDGR